MNDPGKFFLSRFTNIRGVGTFFILGMMVFTGVGCFPFHSHKRISPDATKPPGYSAKLMRPNLLKQGSSVVLVPFTAGTDVEETAELQRTSFMIVKSMTEALQSDSSRLKVLSSESADQADWVVSGHIIERNVPAQGAKRWMLHSKEVSLAYEAKVIERKTGDLILNFSQKKTAEPKQDELSLARSMGEDFVAFLINQIK